MKLNHALPDCPRFFGAPLYVGVTVWVIRYRPEVAEDVEVVLHDARVYQSQGEAVERGGALEGRSERYLEIHTRLRR